MLKRMISIILSIFMVLSALIITPISAQEVMQSSEKVYLREGFAAPDTEYRTVPFYHMNGDISDYDAVNKEMRNSRRIGYGGVSILPVTETKPKGFSEEYYNALGNLLDQLDELGMTAIYYDDVDFPSGHLAGQLLDEYPEIDGKEINKVEFSGQSGNFSRTVNLNEKQKEIIVSAVAVKTSDKSTVDMISGVDGNQVNFSLPEGTYTVYIFTCKTYTWHERVDFFSYDDSNIFVDLSYNEMIRRFPEHMGYTVKMTFYDDIRYFGTHGRSWAYEMNQYFEEEYGIDPTPYYPALVTDIGEDTMWFRAAFMSLRAKLISEGFYKAVGDWGIENGINVTGHAADQHNTDQTNQIGDTMLIQKNVSVPGQDLIHGYMHHFNASKITSSAANNFDKDLVMTEIYGNYPEGSGEPIMYSEAMHAFTRGINYLIPHGLWITEGARIPPQLSYRSPIYGPILQDYNTFAARSQYMLRDGRHVADIGMLYPIRSMEAQAYLAFNIGEPITVPGAPANVDYMDVINSVMNYSNKDLTVLHPETINERMVVEGAELKLQNDKNFENYKVFIMPSSVMIELSNLEKIKEFYDNGGKVIATGILPYKSYEKDKDAEVKAIIAEMFGEPTQYSEKTNANGGKTYYIPGVGNNYAVNSAVLDEALNDALTVYDVSFEDVLDVNNHGVFNFIHKVKDGVDLYYFGNASNTVIDTKVNIRGKITPELWDPMDGTMTEADYEYIKIDGQDVTQIKLNLDAIDSLFVVDVSNVNNSAVLFVDEFDGDTIKWENPQTINGSTLQVSDLTTAIGTKGLADFTIRATADLSKDATVLFRMLDEGDSYEWQFTTESGKIVLQPVANHDFVATDLAKVGTDINATNDMEISITCVKNEIRTYIDGKLISTILDKTNRHGSFGLKTGDFEDVKVIMPPSKKTDVLFSDDFSDGLDQWVNTNNASIAPISTPTADEVFKVKIDINGSIIKTYVNDVLVNTVNDSTHSNGGIGFRESGTEHSYFDNIKVSKDGEVLFEDDFSGDLSKWNDSHAGRIEDGQLRVGSTESMIAKDSGNWDNYVLEADILIGDFAGLTFRAKDGNNYYMWQFYFEGGNLIFKPHIKNNGGYGVFENYFASLGRIGGFLEITNNAGFVAKDSSDWENYTLVADVTVGDTPVGINFRKTSDSSFYMWGLEMKNGKIVIKPHRHYSQIYPEWADGEYITDVTNSRLTLKIVVDGNKFSTYINDEFMFDTIDNTYPTGGIGLRVSGDETGYVHSLKTINEYLSDLDFGNETDSPKPFELPPVIIRPDPAFKISFDTKLNGDSFAGTTINGAGDLSVAVNKGKYTGDVLFIVAKYDVIGRLIDYVIGEESATLNVEVGDKVNIMLTNGEETMAPLIEKISMNVVDKEAKLMGSEDFSASTSAFFGRDSTGATVIENETLRISTNGDGWGGFFVKDNIDYSYYMLADVKAKYHGTESVSNLFARHSANQSYRGLTACANQYNHEAANGNKGRGSVYFILSQGENELNPATDAKMKVRLVDKTTAALDDIMVDLPSGVNFTDTTSVKLVDNKNSISLFAKVGEEYVKIVTVDTTAKKVIDSIGQEQDYTVEINEIGTPGFGAHEQPLWVDNVYLYKVD